MDKATARANKIEKGNNCSFSSSFFFLKIVMAAEECSRIELSTTEIESLNPELRIKWRAIETYVDRLEKKAAGQEGSVQRGSATAHFLLKQYLFIWLTCW